MQYIDQQLYLKFETVELISSIFYDFYDFSFAANSSLDLNSCSSSTHWSNSSMQPVDSSFLFGPELVQSAHMYDDGTRDFELAQVELFKSKGEIPQYKSQEGMFFFFTFI
jgi:hypothetical protein